MVRMTINGPLLITCLLGFLYSINASRPKPVQPIKFHPPQVPKKPPLKPPSTAKKDSVQFLTEEFALSDRIHNEFPVWHAPFSTVAQPWPNPQVYKSSRRFCRIDRTNLSYRLTAEKSSLLNEAIERTRRILMKKYTAASIIIPKMTLKEAITHAATAASFISTVEIKVLHAGHSWPHFKMDESYKLEVTDKGVFIQSSETWGALRALETFLQIIWQTSTYTSFVNHTKIIDYPQFPHRGFLMDTARHYLSIETILTNLDAMAANKFNVLHWHMTDDQSFPFQSEEFPELSQKGAYDPDHQIYTKEKIRMIVDYARRLGIRVIPEFDSPAHSYSWGKAYPQLLTECLTGEASDGYYGPLNPIRNFTYFVLSKLYGEIVSLFPDKFIHLGLDEIPSACWTSNREIKEFMAKNRYEDIREVKKYYIERLLGIVKNIAKGKRQIIWHEGASVGAQLLINTVVQVWMGPIFDVMSMASRGYETLYSACFYLDTMRHWKDAYECNLGDDGPWKKKLLGGEACMWAEKISDTSMLQRAWPNAAAAAERLWSSTKQNINEAGPRLEEQRCRMLRRGIPVGVASGPGACPIFGPLRSLSVSDLNMDAESLHDLRRSIHHSYQLHVESFFYFISTVSVLTLLVILIRSLRPNMPVLCSDLRRILKSPAARLKLFFCITVILVCGFLVSRSLGVSTSS